LLLYKYAPVVAVVEKVSKSLPNRSSLAWDFYKPVRYDDWRTPNRLHVHAVADGSNNQYLREVRIFIQNLKMFNIGVPTKAHFDLALSRELEHRCYGLRQDAQRGKNLVHGVAQVYPELKDSLVLTRRALAGWERLRTAGEGGPMSEAAVMLVVEYFFREGKLFEGLCTLFAFDLYARESDWETVRIEDVHVVRTYGSKVPQVAKVFGSSKRGLTTKTGADHVLPVDSPFLCLILEAITKWLSPTQQLFPFDQVYFRKQWHLALSAVGLPERPPHTLRHSRPSEQVRRKELSLEGVRRRGRWRQMKSVQRYAKEGALVVYEAHVDPGLLRRGSEIMSHPASWLAQAVRRGPARTSSLGLIIRAAARVLSAGGDGAEMAPPLSAERGKVSMRGPATEAFELSLD